ncbi:polymorphic outer membrane protein middle domain-containing protein [Chlamydiifrater volucris]|uniref:polymorphic outer membrane protein middle domain-containing protein n=1 Tax=Chlamydiifrater volucris TaxID=2681470 RepID=UPI001BCE800A|nr:polymorphic outer membrane protein middle domain-containing protein [Chlamydiifrater volucris]
MKFKNKKFSIILLAGLLRISSEAQETPLGTETTEQAISSFDDLIDKTKKPQPTLTLKFSDNISAENKFFTAPENSEQSPEIITEKSVSLLVDGESGTSSPFPGIISTPTSLTLKGENHQFKISGFKLEDNKEKGVSLISSSTLLLSGFSSLEIDSSSLISKIDESAPKALNEETSAPTSFSFLVGSSVTISENGSVTFVGNSSNRIRQANGEALSFDIPSIIQAIPPKASASLPNPETDNPNNTPGKLVVSKNSNVMVKNNSSSTTGGAFAAITMDLSENRSLYFYNNSAKKSGGALAILSNSQTATQPPAPAPSPAPPPAAFLAETNPNAVSLSKNGNIFFYGNVATSGGAISTQNGCSITENRQVVFSSNLADTGGSAIHLAKGSNQTQPTESPQLLFKGNRGVIFSYNTCTGKGGAIFADAGTKISLFADAGDIIFFGNTFQGIENTPPKSEKKSGSGTCAIFLESGQNNSSAAIDTLCASASRTIAFFDSIKCDTSKSSQKSIPVSRETPEEELPEDSPDEPSEPAPPSSDSTQPIPLQMNKVSGETGDGAQVFAEQESYTGTILFSLGRPSYGSNMDGSNQIAEVKQPVTLGAGTLIIDRDTTFKCQSFTQEGKSTIRFGSGSKLETTGAEATEATGKTIAESLKNIEIDLDSFDHIPNSTTESYEKAISIILKPSGQQVASLNADSLKISCTSPQCFAAYNQFSFGTSITFPILKISSGSQGETEMQSLEDITPPGSITINPDTGYSGTLTFEWKGNGVEGKTGDNDKILNATWTPTGYNASANFRSPTFFDASWIGASAARTVSNATLSKIVCPSDKIFLSSSGEGLFSSLNLGKKDARSRYEGKGFEVNLSFGNLSSSSLEVRLARISGDTSNSHFGESMDTDSYVAGFSIQKTSPSKRIGEVFAEASIYYAFSQNNLYSTQSDLNPRKLEFESHSFISAITVSGPFLGTPITPHFFSATPFLKSEFALSKIPSCMEQENISNTLLSRSAIVNISDVIHVLTTLPETRLRKYSGASLYNLSVLTGISLKASPQRLKAPFSLAASVAFVGDPYRHYPSGTFIIPQNNVPVFVKGSSFSRCSCEVSSVIDIDFFKNLAVYADYKGRFASRNYFQSIKVGSSVHF